MARRLISSVFILVCLGFQGWTQVIDVPADQPTIQQGIDAASDGDTLLVADSTYYENINFKGKAITVASHYLVDGDTSHISKTIIDGSKSGSKDSASVVMMVSGEDTTSVLTGFTITGGGGTFWDSPFESFTGKGNLSGGGIFINLSGGKITNNIIEDNHLILPTGGIKYSPDSLTGGAGIYAVVYDKHYLILRDNIIRNNNLDSDNMANGGGVTVVGGNVTVEGNQVYNNSCKSLIGMANGGGIAYFGTAINEGWNKVLIKNNNIYNNSIESVNGNSIPVSLGGGLFINGYNLPLELKVFNNLIHGNSTNGGGGGVGVESGKFELINNTLVDNQAGGAWNGNTLYLRYGNEIILINNILWNNINNGKQEIYINPNSPNVLHSFYNDIKGSGNGDSTNIDADPLFETVSFNLSSDSPCIGRGVDTIDISETQYFAPKMDYCDGLRPNPIDHKVDMGAIESPFSGTVSSKGIIENRLPQLAIYPNPTNDMLTIELNIAEPYSIAITSTNGQLMYNNKVEGHTRQIDLSSFQKGIYITTISSKDYNTTRKIIKL